MKILRIANIIGHADDRQAASRHSYEIPADAVSPGFEIGYVALARPQTMLNDLDRMVTELAYVEAGLRAQAEGFDAIMIGPVADYGMRQLRSVVSIPVVGAGQSSMQVAAGLGRRFAIVTVWPEILRPAYERQLVDYGFAGHCSGLYFVTQDAELPAMLETGEIHSLGTLRGAGLLDRVEEACRTALAEGAEVIVLGCTCMSAARDALADRLAGTLVIDPLRTGYKFAEMLLALGLHPPLSPPSMFAGQLGAMVGALAGTVSAVEDCGDNCSILTAELVSAD
ncbi:MAG TPA: aspartate/glutamate racemase family protein [Rhizorhapis sp.]